MNTRRLTVGGIILGSVAVACWAAPAQAQTNIAPKAERVLAAACQYLAEAPQFSLTAEVWREHSPAIARVPSKILRFIFKKPIMNSIKISVKLGCRRYGPVRIHLTKRSWLHWRTNNLRFPFYTKIKCYRESRSHNRLSSPRTTGFYI